VLRVALKGRYVPERVRKEPGSLFLSRFFIEAGYWYFDPLGEALRPAADHAQPAHGGLARL